VVFSSRQVVSSTWWITSTSCGPFPPLDGPFTLQGGSFPSPGAPLPSPCGPLLSGVVPIVGRCLALSLE